jgi:hypothetical protein
MDTGVYQASKKRLFLSWYIDFLFFMTLWGLLSYFLKLNPPLPYWAPYLIFIVIRAVTGKYVGSIGYAFLAIDNEEKTVNPKIYERENWLTILLGMLLILEGTKQLVRWTQLFEHLPIFGFFPDGAVQITVHIVFGISSILAGYWFLKLDIKGLYLGILLGLINILSDALSWNLWDPVVEKMVIARRALQGVPVREGEIAFMQSLFPEGMLAVVSITIVAMLFTCKRFKSV